MIGGTVSYNLQLNASNLVNIDNVIIEGFLARIGLEGVEILKANLENALPHGSATGRTKDSFTFKTKHQQGKGGTEYEFPVPEAPTSVFIGSGKPSAFFIDTGTGKHKKDMGADEFVASMIEWGRARGLDEDAIQHAINVVRNRGTDSYPYVAQSKLDIDDMAQRVAKEMAAAIADYLNGRK